MYKLANKECNLLQSDIAMLILGLYLCLLNLKARSSVHQSLRQLQCQLIRIFFYIKHSLAQGLKLSSLLSYVSAPTTKLQSQSHFPAKLIFNYIIKIALS